MCLFVLKMYSFTIRQRKADIDKSWKAEVSRAFIRSLVKQILYSHNHPIQSEMNFCAFLVNYSNKIISLLGFVIKIMSGVNLKMFHIKWIMNKK